MVLREQGGKRTFVPFPDYQVKKSSRIGERFVTRYQISPTNVLAHSDIAPNQKNKIHTHFFLWKNYMMNTE